MEDIDLHLRNKKGDLEIQLEILLSIICRNHLVFTNRKAKRLNIKGRHIPCLMLISDFPGITQDEIAYIHQIDKGFIARIVKELEDDEFLCRTIDPENRRKYHISLTEKGKDIIPKIKDIDEEWKDVVCEGLNEDEISKLMEFMNLLAENSIEKIRNRT